MSENPTHQGVHGAAADAGSEEYVLDDYGLGSSLGDGYEYDQAPGPSHDRQHQAEAELLVRDYPELVDERVQDEVLQYASDAANHLGQPALASDPGFIRMCIQANGGLQETHERTLGDMIVDGDGPGSRALPYF